MPDKIPLNTNDGGDWTPISVGTHIAVLVDTISLGYRPESYQNQPKQLKQKLALVWATAERQEDGTLKTVQQELTASLGQRAKLRQILETVRGKPYTPEEINAIGKNPDFLAGLVGKLKALISVEHKVSAQGRTYGKVGGILPLPKGTKVTFDVTDYVRGEWWQKKIDRYAEETAAFEEAHDDEPEEDGPPPDPTQAEELEDFPQSLKDQPDDLPF